MIKWLITSKIDQFIHTFDKDWFIWRFKAKLEVNCFYDQNSELLYFNILSGKLRILIRIWQASVLTMWAENLKTLSYQRILYKVFCCHCQWNFWTIRRSAAFSFRILLTLLNCRGLCIVLSFISSRLWSEKQLFKNSQHNVSRIPQVGKWFTLWFPFPHDSILILSLKRRQQLAWLMSSKECLATLPNQGRLCKKKMHFCIVEAWVWHSIKGLGNKLLVSPHPIPNFSFKVQRELYIFFTLLVIGR